MYKSNYSIVGFIVEVFLKELVEIGIVYDIVVMEDLGSGSFVDFLVYGFMKELMV